MTKLLSRHGGQTRYAVLVAACILLIVLLKGSGSTSIEQSSTQQSPFPPNEILSNIPDVGIHLAKIWVNNSFVYGHLIQDDDSFQVKDEQVRSLEPGLSALWEHLLPACCKAGGYVIDVGSHFGYYALLGHSVGCKFIAFEPVPLFRSVLDFNLHLNGVNGTVYPYALGNEEKTVHIAVPTAGVLGTAHVTGDAGEEGVDVQQMRIDKLIPPSKMPSICMLKVDVEGWEPQIILSSKSLLETKKVKYIMMEFSPGYTQEGLEEMLKLLHSIGYSAIEVPWHLAKMGAPVGQITVDMVLEKGNEVDISTTEKRNEFIERITKVFNTNLWLTL